MWFYSNFKWEDSLDGEFNSTSNEYPLNILLLEPAPRKTRNNWIPHPMATPVLNLSKTTWRYVENTSWKSSFSLFNYFLSFYIFTQFFYHFTFKNGDSSPMVDIINLNPIGSYKVDFCCTFLFWGPFFTSKFL